MTKQSKMPALQKYQPPKKRKLKSSLSIDVILVSILWPFPLAGAFIAAHAFGAPTPYALLGLYVILLLWYRPTSKRLFQTSYSDQPAAMIRTGLSLIWVPFATGVFQPFASLLPSVVTANLPMTASYGLLRSPIAWHHAVEAAAFWLFLPIPGLLGLALLVRGVYYIVKHLSGDPLPDAYLEPHSPDWYDLKLMVDDLTEKNTALSQQAKDLTSERDTLGFELNQAKTEVANLTKHASELSIERRGLLDELTSLKQQHRQLAENFNASQETVLVLRKAYEEMAAKVKATATLGATPRSSSTDTVTDDAPATSFQSAAFIPRPKENLRERQIQLNALTSKGASTSAPSGNEQAASVPSGPADPRDSVEDVRQVNDVTASLPQHQTPTAYQQDEQGIEADSIEAVVFADDGEDDQPETTVAPTSIALKAVDDDAVIQGELIPDTEQKTVDDIEDDHRAVTMPAVSDATDAGPEDADPETVDEIEPQDADLDHEEQPKESSECETAPVEPAVPDYVRPFAPSTADKTPTARELEGDRFDDMRKMAAEYFKARREHPERFDDLNGTKPLRKEEIILRDCIKRLNKNKATPENQPAQPSQPRAAIWQPFTQTPQTESDFTNLTRWGVEDPDKLIVLSPAHGTHEFEDNKHLHNFVGYLFSLSKNHKSNDDTPKNTILQWRRGQIQDILLNDDPRRHRENFTQMFYTIFERYAELLDDVAYAGFIVDVNGTLYSNMVTAEAKDGDYHVTVFQPEVFRLAAEQIGGAENLKQAIERITGETRPVLNWETADIKEVGHQIDITCQKLFSIVDPGTLYISISHRDQTDHNQIYHIHRIRDRKPGELATISQAEIAERDKLWLNPKTESPKPQTTHYAELAEQPIPDFETLRKQALEDAAKLKAANETPPSA